MAAVYYSPQVVQAQVVKFLRDLAELVETKGLVDLELDCKTLVGKKTGKRRLKVDLSLKAKA